MKTLMIIDMQRGYIKDGAQALIPKINLLPDRFDRCIYIKTINDESCSARLLANWKALATSAQQEIVVNIKSGSKVFERNTHGIPQQVIDYLKRMGAKEVYLCGLDADICILAIAHQLFDNGIMPLVLREYTTTSSSHKHLADYAFEIMKRSFGKKSVVEKF